MYKDDKYQKVNIVYLFEHFEKILGIMNFSKSSSPKKKMCN